MRTRTGVLIGDAGRAGDACRRLVGAGIAAAALLSAHAADARRAVVVRRYATGGWIAHVADDRFTGERRCTLQSRSGTMIYQPGAIGFRVGSRDTLDAVYRVDGGPPVRWQDRYPALIAAGVEVDGGGLGDPTGRIVWIPEAELAHAQVVAVRTGDSGWGRRFALGGATAMIAATKRLGCTVRTGF